VVIVAFVLPPAAFGNTAIGPAAPAFRAGACSARGEFPALQPAVPGYVNPVFQIIFNELSAAEISRLDTVLQLELLTEFKVSPEDLQKVDGERFGKLEREGKTLYRYRAKGYRIYFEVVDDGVRVHRVLHKNSLEDFLFRNSSRVAGHEDEVLAKSKSFWKLIEEGQKAKKA
jgi:mRNA-degrading endonuclease RelE of RelBE toxin-antitoxin system